MTVAFYFILKAFNTANLIMSTLSVSTSFFAVCLTFRRSVFFPLAYAVNDVVQTAFEQGEKDFAGVARAAAGFRVVTTELAFENAVGTLNLLLFTQLRTVVRETRTGNLAVLAGLDFGVLDLGVKGTAGALQIEVGTLAARELQLGTEISCHFMCYLFYPAARTAFSLRLTI